MLRIAFMSDLHVGKHARGLDMCPHPLSDSEKVAKESNYMDSFDNFLDGTETKDRGPIDLLCITGDISNGGHVDEFRMADEIISRVAARLGVPDDGVFFVPGNHDIHWPVMKLEPTAFWERMKYAPLLQNNLKLAKHLARKTSGAFDEHPHFVLWENTKVFVVAINSAAYDGPEVKNHSGIVKQASVEALKSSLETSLRQDDQRLRLCLIHHHPIQYSEPTPDAQDVSIVTNAENLLSVLTDFRFDLLLHGHKHHPRLNTHSGNNSQPYVTLGAGSFSATLSPTYYGSLSNLFHIVNVRGRNADTNGIEGSVQTWMYNPRDKWQKSHHKVGMPHIEVFGTNYAPNEIETRVRGAVLERLKVDPVCSIADIESADASLKHVRRSSLFNALKSISDEQKLKMIGDPETSEEHWAVFQRSA